MNSILKTSQPAFSADREEHAPAETHCSTDTIMKSKSQALLSLRSPLTLNECYMRLSESIDNSLFSQFGNKPIAGKVSRTSIKIRKLIRYRNSFQIIFNGYLAQDAGGTIIKGKFGMHPFVKAFMFIWFGFIILFGGVFWIVLIAGFILKSSLPEGDAWMGVIIPPLLIAFGIGLLKFGKYLSRDESVYLKKFLIKKLNAEEIEVVEPPRSRGRTP